MMTSTEIRSQFLEFFTSKQHHIVPSAPIVVKNDPTLMFTNAGMNQFKDYFLGNKPAPYPRIADTQKCLRVSGKHNDLEEVGVDTYHHTMFEMLGNWSFGDYFKKEAIEWSWEFLTSVLNIPKDRLYVTIFEGDVKEGLPKDEESENEWKKWIDEDRILLGNKKDNFWEMGDTGPCGPCTEIHVDTRTDEERKKIDGKTLVNADHPQVIEIWNDVFIQYNRLKDGTLEALPSKNVDTGMGFERLVRVIQGKHSNYDTDVFSGTIKKIEEITNQKYGGTDSKSDIAFRVLADHIRAISFTIADGQLPSNTGAGYVIRRILRRAVRYYYSYLNYQQPLLFQLVPVIAKQFENVFPELHKQEQFVVNAIMQEEINFLRTIQAGIDKINGFYYQYVFEPAKKNYEEEFGEFGIEEEKWKAVERKTSEKVVISGKDAFELYDTYGFPLDLTELMAREKGWTIDIEGFTKAMQKQKERSRAATAIDTEDWITVNEGNSNEFVGYDVLETEAKVLKYRRVKAKGKEAYQIVLNKTPFYAESGGQVGDTGEIILPSPPGEGPGVRLRIVDTKKENDLIIHFAEKLPESFEGKVLAKVDAVRRNHIAVHHSATHLLHAALRNVLGTHVGQKGSLVNADYLRFDFSHFSKMMEEEIRQVEEIVNKKIRENIPVAIRYMPKEEATKTGAMALFGEKYGDTVRVVTMDPGYSIELCGGTHVGATGELGFFKIISESAIAAGVRRIEAVSGFAAESYLYEKLNQIKSIQETLNAPKDIVKGVEKLVTEKSELQKKIESIELAKSNELIDTLLKNNLKKFKDAYLVTGTIDVYSVEIFKRVIFTLKNKLQNVIIVLGATIDTKNSFQILLNPKSSSILDLNMNAKTIIEQIEPYMKERYFGGNNKMVQGSAVFSEDFRTVIEKMSKFTEDQIKGLYELDKSLDDFLNNPES